MEFNDHKVKSIWPFTFMLYEISGALIVSSPLMLTGKFNRSLHIRVIDYSMIMDFAHCIWLMKAITHFRTKVIIKH
jgi:hypothetical protein